MVYQYKALSNTAECWHFVQIMGRGVQVPFLTSFELIIDINESVACKGKKTTPNIFLFNSQGLIYFANWFRSEKSNKFYNENLAWKLKSKTELTLRVTSIVFKLLHFLGQWTSWQTVQTLSMQWSYLSNYNLFY